MRPLTLLLFVGAVAVGQSAQAHAQSSPAAIQTACADDAQKFCAGMQPGGGRIVACLKQNKDSLSDRCRQAAGLPPKVGNGSAPGGAVPSAASSGSVGMPSISTPASDTKPTNATKATPATATKAKAAAGSSEEKFVEHVIPDAQHNGLRAATIH